MMMMIMMMMMMMMQYTNCVVKAHKVQTVKLTLYRLLVQISMTCSICEISAVYNQQSGKAQISDVNQSKMLIKF